MIKTTLVILIIAALLFFIVYYAHKGGKINKKVAAILEAFAVSLAFVGPYIVNLTDVTDNPTTTSESTSVSDVNTGDTTPGLIADVDTGSTTPVLTPDVDTGSTTPVSAPDVDTESTTSVPTPDPDGVSNESTTSVQIHNSELSIDKIADVQMDVQSIEPIVAENDDAKIDVYNDSLTVENQVKRYSFTPSVTGRYRFEISGLTEGTGHAVNLVIKNSGGGAIKSTSYGITNGDGLTVDDMQDGETFQVQVKQYAGLDSYTLSIGNQKKEKDVTGYTIVKDSLEFIDQRNVYMFTPPITGRYRFEISDLTKGANHAVNLVIKNSGGGTIKSTSYGITNGDGLTIDDMQAGETFQIQVKQYSGLDSYNLNIGYQKDSVDISGYNIVSDSIQYCNQKNVYFFTPTVSGRYRFEISNLTKGSNNEVNLYIWNSRGGEEGSTSYGINNGGGLTIKDMKAGETYQIQVLQYKGYDTYNLNIGLQKETVDISEYSSLSDSIQYTDQQNLYTFTPPSSGKYRFEIQGLTDNSNNDVNILVLNSRGGEEGSTSYGSKANNGLNIKNMQAGETYKVKVQYYSGFDSYKLITTKVSE